MEQLRDACNQAQEALQACFWQEDVQFYAHHFPPQKEEPFVYWWHAHSIDALADGYQRTQDPVYLDRIRRELTGTFRKNGNTFLHNWYDDMEWFGLALLRLWDITGDQRCLEQTLLIWEDVRTAWNDHMGGGMAWQKKQPDYKNTPANAPAAILALRLYRRLRREEDLEWGKRIFDWNLRNLVDPGTGFVWDGINRLGDGKIDYEWEFTYCQGVFMQAALELYQISRKKEYLDLAVRTAREAKRRLADEKGGIIPYEGPDDCGLFRGIFFRYSYELLKQCPELTDIRRMILDHACTVAECGMNEQGLIGGDWKHPASEPVDLAQHLSGIMVLEMALKCEEGI